MVRRHRDSLCEAALALKHKVLGATLLGRGGPQAIPTQTIGRPSGQVSGEPGAICEFVARCRLTYDPDIDLFRIAVVVKGGSGGGWGWGLETQALDFDYSRLQPSTIYRASSEEFVRGMDATIRAIRDHYRICYAPVPDPKTVGARWTTIGYLW